MCVFVSGQLVVVVCIERYVYMAVVPSPFGPGVALCLIKEKAYNYNLWQNVNQ